MFVYFLLINSLPSPLLSFLFYSFYKYFYKMERPEDAAPAGGAVEVEASTDESKEETAPRATTTEDAPATEAAREEGWVYLDDTGAERGPFTLQEMLTWWNCSLLRADLQVKRQSEEQFTDLSARPEFNPQLYYETYYAQYYYGQQPQQDNSNYYNAAQGVAATGAAAAPAVASTTAAAVGDPDKELAARLMAEDAGYSQVGTFNARTGR